MKSTMRPIRSLISTKFVDRTKIIQSLTTSIHSRLPLALRQHCWVVDIIGNNLLIITDKAERATILHYQQHELLKQVNEEFSTSLAVPVRRLKVKVDHHLSTLAKREYNQCDRPESAKENAKNHCRQMLDFLNKS